MANGNSNYWLCNYYDNHFYASCATDNSKEPLMNEFLTHLKTTIGYLWFITTVALIAGYIVNYLY